MTKLQMTFSEIFLWQERAAIRISQNCVKPALSEVYPIVFQFKVLCCTNLNPFPDIVTYHQYFRTCLVSYYDVLLAKRKGPTTTSPISHVFYHVDLSLGRCQLIISHYNLVISPYYVYIYICIPFTKHMSHVQKLDQIYSNMMAQY